MKQKSADGYVRYTSIYINSHKLAKKILLVNDIFVFFGVYIPNHLRYRKYIFFYYVRF